MKVYIAAPFHEREAVLKMKEALEDLGHTITSRWVTEHTTDYDALSDEKLTEEAEADLTDILDSDILVLLNQFPPSPGRFFEFGFAAACGIFIYAIGTGTKSVFLHLPGVCHREDDSRLVEDFEKLSRAFQGGPDGFSGPEPRN